MKKVWLISIAFMIVGVAILCLQQFSVEGKPAVELPPTPLPTATPDMSESLGNAEAAKALSDVPGVGEVLSAITAGDVEQVLALTSWQLVPCGTRGSTACPSGVADQTNLEMVRGSSGIEFWIDVNRARLVLSRVLSAPVPKLTFASRAASDYDGATGDLYFVGLEGTAKGEGMPEIPGFPYPFAGLFVVIDAGKDRPILRFEVIGASTTAVGHAEQLPLTDHEIITWPTSGQQDTP
jgi:hypothetical protein